MEHRSDTLRPRLAGSNETVRSAGKKAVRKEDNLGKRNLRGRSGKRWAASRNQTGWSVAIAAAKIFLQVSSSGVIADAGNVSVNARLGRTGEEGKGQEVASRRGSGTGLEGVRSLFFSVKFQCRA